MRVDALALHLPGRSEKQLLEVATVWSSRSCGSMHVAARLRASRRFAWKARRLTTSSSSPGLMDEVQELHVGGMQIGRHPSRPTRAKAKPMTGVGRSVKGPRNIRAYMDAYWRSPEAQQALERMASSRFDIMCRHAMQVGAFKQPPWRTLCLCFVFSSVCLFVCAMRRPGSFPC